MTELMTRTPALIAAEINNLTEQGRAVMLYYSIEIGRRLAEARQIIGHGGWAEWLRENVAFSASTANNHIRVFQAYGDRTAALTGEAPSSNLQALGDLSYTQAVALLALSDEDRSDFLEDHDVASMSSRELQAAIRERDEALRERDDAKSKLADAEADAKLAEESLEGQRSIAKTLEEQKRDIWQQKVQAERDADGKIDRLKRERNDADAKVKRLEAELRQFQASKPSEADDDTDVEEDAEPAAMAELKQQLATAEADRSRLQSEIEDLRAAKPDVEASYTGVEPVVPPEVQQELDRLHAREAAAADTARFRAAFELLTDNFGKLLDALQALPEDDKPRYRKAVDGLLAKMAASNGAA